MRILSLNAGSSTLKFALFDLASGQRLTRGVVDRLGQDEALLTMTIGDGKEISEQVGHIKMPEAVSHVLDRIGEIDAVGCRVVHGGDRFECATLVNSDVVQTILELAPLAPLHNARDLDVIKAVQKLRPEHSLVAVFDTTFHRTIPALAERYAIPSAHAKEKFVRRFGFHGISYRYVIDKMEAVRGTKDGRIVACHLGNGASICAVLNGESIETSMGMTPVEGLVMGTRSGDIDPGAVLYLLREAKMTVSQVDYLLNHESGLLGLSGQSGDVRELEGLASKGDPEAEFALESFAYRVAKYVGSYSVVLNGLNALVFTGGIGEHSADMRGRICRRLGSLGIGEPTGQIGGDAVTCLSGSQVPSVWVVRTDEERQIANETLSVISSASL